MQLSDDREEFCLYCVFNYEAHNKHIFSVCISRIQPENSKNFSQQSVKAKFPIPLDLSAFQSLLIIDDVEKVRNPRTLRK